MNINEIREQTIEALWHEDNKIFLDVLRLDLIDEVVSGNKWFKLKYDLQQAKQIGATTIATFGGAWSNHIVASAFAAGEAGLRSVGVIRGQEPAIVSATLNAAINYNMQLIFVSRHEYNNKEKIIETYKHENWYWINEGGYGTLGAQGAAEILSIIDASKYTHIVAAVGTGTMLAGLILSLKQNQHVVGISSMKGNMTLSNDVKKLLPQQLHNEFSIINDYHFGGYAKHPPALIDYINEVYVKHQLPLDVVYTSKTFYAIENLAKKSYFKPGSKILMIHSGGLQGNKSLPAKVLAF